MDLEKIRSDTPAVDSLIHFNNAGASLSPKPVFDQLIEYLSLEQSAGGYEAAAAKHAELEEFYDACARLLNCNPDEIAFSDSASRSWQLFFNSLRFKRGDRILTSVVDYGTSFVGYIQRALNMGVEIDVVGRDANGDIDLEQLQNSITARTRLISVSHIPTGSGLILPARRIGEIAASAGVPYLLDACQSVGQIEVDVQAIGCTALTATGRKYLRGPRGTGFLYIRKDALGALSPVSLDQAGVTLVDRDHFDLKPSARQMENFEGHFAGKLALGAAMNYAKKIGMDNIEFRIRSLAGTLRQLLADIPSVSVCDLGTDLGGIVTFRSDRLAAADIKQQLGKVGINVSVVTGPGNLVDFQDRSLDAVVRASVHYFNTDQELEVLAHELGRLTGS